MARFNCLPALLIGKKKKSKELLKADVIKKGDDNIILLGKKECIVNPLIKEVKKESSFDAPLTTGNKEVSPPNINTHKVREENSIRAGVPPETAYEGGDEHDDILSMKRDFSDFDLQALAADNVEVSLHGLVEINPELNKGMDNNSDRYEGITPEGMIYNGHVSDPGMGRTTALWGSPTLKRSCSNIEAKRASHTLASPTKTHSYGDLQILSGNAGGNPFNGFHGSPHSLKSNCSADRVMLKKRSSSQVLPSRSRRLWWKLFLWSHRNLHRSRTMKPQRISSMNCASQKKEGYTSDTLEPSHSIDRKNKLATDERGKGKLTDMLPQNQWVAFSAESSSLDRVNAWVSSLTVSPSGLIDDDGNVDGGDIVYPSSPEIGESSGKNHTHAGRRLAEEVVQANSIIQSLNSFSSVAHISGMGLKVIPAIAAFSSLRSVNLSGNYIAHITPGSLPKSLHTLDLSRNKIATIEGLRDLTRLRVLNLSYNRIVRIGHGLSNCTLIKELYLAGNKISDVEGLHRLLKLTVLDLSFNKITTAKALSQLVANYNSLLAINLLGNPIQTNIGDDQLRKALTGLLPQLAYLNKQPIKPQRAREVATDGIAKAALGNGGWSSRRKCTRRVSQGLGSSISGHRAVGSGSIAGQNGSRNRSKSRQKH